VLRRLDLWIDGRSLSSKTSRTRTGQWHRPILLDLQTDSGPNSAGYEHPDRCTQPVRFHRTHQQPVLQTWQVAIW